MPGVRSRSVDHAGLDADLGAKMASTRSHTQPTCSEPLQTTRASLLIWQPKWPMSEIKREPEAEIKRLATQVWMLTWQPRSTRKQVPTRERIKRTACLVFSLSAFLWSLGSRIRVLRVELFWRLFPSILWLFGHHPKDR